MVAVIADDLDVCMDCAALIANDEATDEHRALVAQHDDGSEPGTWVLTGEGDVDDTPFSTAPCDSCGTTLAGYRTKAAILL